jgi:oligosaccharide repeat unit polymerase
MVILVSFLAGTLTAWFSRRLLSGLFNPLSLFVGIWSTLFAAYSIELLPYYEVQKSTWVTLILSGCMFSLGCLLAVPFVRPNSKRAVLVEFVDLVKLRRTTFVLYLIGLALFIVYATEIHSRYTLSHFLMEPWHLREDIGQRDVGWSLRYFYFTMPAAVLAFLYMRIADDSRFRMRCILWTSLMLGTATTGRIAVIWLLAWLACLYIYLPAPGKPLQKKLKVLLITALALVLTFGFFVAAGNWVGKTYQNSGFAKVNRWGDQLSALFIPYFYLTSNVPAFQNLLMEQPTYAGGKYTMLPLMKILAPVTGVRAPSDLGDFTQTPYLGNTYTYLWPYYMDFGYAGILVGPLLLGFVISFFYLRMKRVRTTLGLLFANALLATVVIFSFGNNRMITPPTWWFLFLAPIIGRICRVSRRSPGNREPVFVASARAGLRT